jgi:hypothetical protein
VLSKQAKNVLQKEKERKKEEKEEKNNSSAILSSRHLSQFCYRRHFWARFVLLCLSFVAFTCFFVNVFNCKFSLMLSIPKYVVEAAGGVAQWSSHSHEEQTIWVRVPPRNKEVENRSNAV